ncbi:fasciclin domain-containing protein [Marinomonas algicola]|uniref:fasciclin domain-containing protein n=1 Tax=Marinomonas algicola TaxID=2773454 RepID=UPI0019D599F4|nr:fasciclin domain-containing protein [Marinomonas algicola]
MNSANTVQGQAVTVKASNGNVMINDAKVAIADVEASNGVIHVIDKVLLPKECKLSLNDKSRV